MIKTTIKMFEKITSKSRILIERYTKKYETVIDNEIELGNIKKTDTVLFVGAGAIPFTPILLARKTGCKVIGIDCDLRAVKQAKNVINKLRLNDLVSIEYGDGVTHEGFIFNKSILALQVSPLNRVIDVLSLQCDTVIIRQPFYRYRHHYDQLDNRVEVLSEINQPMKFFGTSKRVKNL